MFRCPSLGGQQEEFRRRVVRKSISVYFSNRITSLKLTKPVRTSTERVSYNNHVGSYQKKLFYFTAILRIVIIGHLFRQMSLYLYIFILITNNQAIVRCVHKK